MSAASLAALGRGFASPGAHSQQVFRAALEALARPGRILEPAFEAELPAGLHPAAGALALALLDHDTILWRSAALGGEALGAYLRFHTGCVLTDDPARADFALAQANELPDLAAFACGSDEYPDRSATLIVQAAFLRDGAGWALTGPGIRHVERLAVGGMPAGFVPMWRANVARYPRGVDLFLASGARLCGLPRTTRVEA